MTKAAQLYYRPNEDGEQMAVVEYCELRGIDVVHIPNEGKRSAANGARMKRMGLKKGFPDLEFPIPVGKYHGLYIEMKANGGKLEPDQKRWLEKLNARGYRACVCVGADEAITEVNEYLAGRR